MIHMNSICKIPELTQRDAIYLLVLILIVSLFQYSILIQGEIPLDEDSLLFFYPLRALHQDPHVGFWDPYLFCGFPREANPQSQLLYPPNLIFQIFSTPIGFTVLMIGHILVGAVGMGLLLRGLHLSSEAALFGAITFLVSTFWRCKITNLGLLEGISWIPFVLYYFLLGLESGRWTPRMTAALFLAMVILAGVPHTVIYTVIFLSLITASYFLFRERPILASFTTFCTTIGSAAFLSIGMWLPALLYLPLSGRTPLALNHALEGSIPWYDIWKVFLGGLSQPEISRCDPWEGTCYIGVTALFFLPFGFRSIPGRLRVGLVASLLFAIVCALGNDGGLFPFLFHYFPGWNTINLPNRSLLIAALVLPIFAGFGLQCWITGKFVTRTWIVFLSLTGLLLFGVAAFTCLHLPGAWQSILNPSLTGIFQSHSMTDTNWALISFALWMSMTMGIVLLFVISKNRLFPSFPLLILLLLTQSALYSPRLFLQTTSADFFTLPETVQSAEKNAAPAGSRICSFVPMIDAGSDVRMPLNRPAMMHRLPEVYRINEIQGYDPLFPKYYAELVRKWAGQSPSSDPTRTIRLDSIPKSLLNFLAVSTLIGYPNHENLYYGKTVEMDKPGKIVSPLKESKTSEAVTFRWVLAGAESIPQGTIVAKIHVLNASEIIQTFPVRAGVEIANYIMDAPNSTIRHKSANLYRWFPVPSPEGYINIHQYLATIPLSRPSLIDQVAIEFLSAIGRMAIMEIDLFTSDRHGFQEINQAAELPIYSNPDAFPPVYLTRRVMRYTSLDALIETFRDVKSSDEIPVFFEANENIPFESSPVSNPNHNPETIQYRRPYSDLIQIQTQSKYDGLLVITENYSSNWSAKVDGKYVPVFRANHTFLAVPITAGNHQVSVEYLPRLFYFSISISGSVLALIILLLIMHPHRWLLPPRNKNDWISL